jgi:ribonuclease P protein component
MQMLRQLRKRAEFVRAARGIRAGRSAFSLQAIASAGEMPGIGYTVTKKTGNSPQRNRIKRRLRAAARACAAEFLPQNDYVIVGRREALGANFAALVRDLSSSIVKVHSTRADGPRKPK